MSEFEIDSNGIFIANDTNLKKAVSSYILNNKHNLPPIGEWNTSNVTDMQGLFKFPISSRKFNEDISRWDVSNVTNMWEVFANSEFNHPLNSWNVSNVLTMIGMFKNNSKFNQPLNQWNVSSCEGFSEMFENARSFNQDISSWNVSKNEYFNNMFNGAAQFNSPLDSWVVSNAISLERMFQDAVRFNQPLNSWNVSNVSDFSSMFYGAKSFSQPLNSWNVSSGTDFASMFKGALAFRRIHISKWKNPLLKTEKMFDNSIINDHITRTILRKNQRSLLTSDKVHERFEDMLRRFEDNPVTVINSTDFVDDKMLHNQSNPYMIHYETTSNGGAYPIVTILKGTILFTARTMINEHLGTSFSHLYKIHDNSTLSSYTANQFADTLTYFFPFPYLSNIIRASYETLDMVVLTKDVRLLCMISPSPVNRTYKIDKEKHQSFEGSNVEEINDEVVTNVAHRVRACDGREYDLCIDKELIDELKLNGYIAIAQQDSFTHNKESDRFDDIMKMLSENVNLLLKKACCFNNEVYNDAYESSLSFVTQTPPQPSSFIEAMTETKYRTMGIPEIVLIPYDIHAHPSEAEYQATYTQFQNNMNTDNVDHSHFVFKHVAHVDGNSSLDIAMRMETLMRNNYPFGSVLSKSLQAVPLLTLLNEEVSPEHQDYMKRSLDFTLEEMSFIEGYSSPSRSKCAFELVGFYLELSKLDGNVSSTGGTQRATTRRNRRGSKRCKRKCKSKSTRRCRTRRHQGGKVSAMEYNPSMFVQKSPVNINEKNSVPSNKGFVKPLEPVRFENDLFYYSEVSGMPILAIK